MKKVLIISGGMNTGGAEKWLLDFSKNIDNTKVELHYLFHYSEKQFYENDLLCLGIKIHRVVTKNPISYISKLKKIVTQNQIQLIHSHVNHFSSIISLIKLFTHVKVIVHAHNDLEYMVTKSKPLKKVYYKFSEWLIPKLADVMIAVSEKASLSLFKNVCKGDERIRVIHCGIDFEFIKSSLLDDNSDLLDNFKFKINYTSDKMYVFHVGRFVEQKNHEFIFKTAQKMQAINSKIEFVLVGDGLLLEYFKNLMQ